MTQQHSAHAIHCSAEGEDPSSAGAWYPSQHAWRSCAAHLQMEHGFGRHDGPGQGCGPVQQAYLTWGSINLLQHGPRPGTSPALPCIPSEAVHWEQHSQHTLEIMGAARRFGWCRIRCDGGMLRLQLPCSNSYLQHAGTYAGTSPASPVDMQGCFPALTASAGCIQGESLHLG